MTAYVGVKAKDVRELASYSGMGMPKGSQIPLLNQQSREPGSNPKCVNPC